MTKLAFPLEFVGPGTPGSGSGVLRPGEEGVFTKLAGVTEPAAMSPPNVELTPIMRDKLEQYLYEEIEICRSERLEQIKMFARLKRKYRTKFPEVPKDWPMANSSQITIPIIKTTVNTLTARLFQTVMAAEPLASIRTRDTESMFHDIAFDYEEFLDLYDRDIINIEPILDTTLTEVIKLGTSILEVTSVLDQRNQVIWDPNTGQYVKTKITRHDGPIVHNVPIEDFWIRPVWQDLQKAPWCGKVVRYSWSELKEMALSGELDPELVGEIWPFTSADEIAKPPTIEADEEVEKSQSNFRDLYPIFELAVKWDVDGDGIEEELIVRYSHEARKLLRVRFNGFRNLRRPWVVFRYIPIEYRFYGEGIAELLEHLQEEISTIHNQRIDNATVANLQIILVRRLIQGLRPGDRLWSGKIVKVGDVVQDVGTLRLGEVYPSTVQNEIISNQIVRETSGVGEAALGQATPVSRTTATAQLALLEELNRRYDKTLKGFRRSLKEMHVHLTDLFLSQGTAGRAEEWLGIQRGQRLDAFLRQPGTFFDSKLKVQIMETKSSVNREVEFQTNVAVMNLIVQHGSQLMAMTQQFAPQMLPVILHEILKSIRPVFKKVMQYAGSPNPDEAISALTVLTRILPTPEDFGGMGQAQEAETAALASNGGGGPGAAGTEAGGLGGAQATEAISRLEAIVSSFQSRSR